MSEALALIKKREKLTLKKNYTQKPSMYIVTVRKVYPYQVVGSIKIGHLLVSSLALIFSKTREEVKKILRHTILTNQKVSFGAYTREIAETKEGQATNAFNPLSSTVEIVFDIEPILD